MLNKDQAYIIAATHYVQEMLEDAGISEMMQEDNPELFDAYCSLLCQAGIDIPDPSGGE